MAVGESGENIENYGHLIFDDENRCIYIPGLIGFHRVDDKCFSDICSRIILKKPLDGTYSAGNISFTLKTKEDGMPYVSCLFDNRRINLAEF